jgi:hypothetical protein
MLIIKETRMTNETIVKKKCLCPKEGVTYKKEPRIKIFTHLLLHPKQLHDGTFSPVKFIRNLTTTHKT